MILPKLFYKKSLGIDVGTSAIRIVELSSRGEKKVLENYAEIKAGTAYQEQFRTFEKNTISISSRDVAMAIKMMKERADIKTNDCIFAIPDFSSFFTNFELPPMTKKELPKAVVYEARQHIPLPLGEVALDWGVIEGEVSEKEKTKLKILLVAVPTDVINQYQEIAKLSGLQVLALEAEVFGLVRALVTTNAEETISIIDIGAQTTTCSIIDKGVLKLSHSFDLSGDDFTERIAKSLSLDEQTAQKLKEKYGLKDVPLPSVNSGPVSTEANIKAILIPLIDDVLREIKDTVDNFQSVENKEVQKFILAGGTALMPGLKEYFESEIGKKVEVANPFLSISYPGILEEGLKEIGPSYAVAVGAALRGFV